MKIKINKKDKMLINKSNHGMCCMDKVLEAFKYKNIRYVFSYIFYRENNLILLFINPTHTP